MFGDYLLIVNKMAFFAISQGSEISTCLFVIRMVGPHPHLVRQREAKWINIMEQWQTILLKKTNMVCWRDEILHIIRMKPSC